MKVIAYIKHPKHVTFEYNKITDHIYLGTNQCCQMHFDTKLLNKGVKADISLEKEKVDAPYGVQYYLWLPVADKKAPTQKQLLLGAQAIDYFVTSDVKVYLHCRRGHGRSPTLAAAYFIFTGSKPNEAIQKVRKKRSIHLTNTQIKALKSFEKLVERIP